MAQLQFNAATVDPFGDRTPVPAGEYPVVLVQSSAEANKQNSGKMLSCQFRITEGDLAGKVIYQNINYLHNNPAAQEIGQAKLSALCHAVGVLQIVDSQQLHGIPLRIAVSVSSDNKYNEIDAYKRADGQPIVKGAASPVGGAAAAAPPAWAQPQQQAPANVVPMPQQQPAPVAQQPAPQQYAPPPQQQMPQAQPPAQWAPPPQQAAPAPMQQAPAPQPAPQMQPPPAQPPGGVTPPWLKQPGT